MKLRITDTLVLLLDDDENAVEQVPIASFHKVFYGQNKKEADVLLPAAVRWVNSSRSAFALERPPSTRSIAHQGVIHVLSFPWTIHIVDFNTAQVNVFARPHQLFSPKEKLFEFPFGSSTYSVDECFLDASQRNQHLLNIVERFFEDFFIPDDTTKLRQVFEVDTDEELLERWASFDVFNVMSLPYEPLEEFSEYVGRHEKENILSPMSYLQQLFAEAREL